MSENSGVSRRTLAKGAAWSVPAVAVAAAAPAMAASCDAVYSFAQRACKWSGANNQWAYHLVLRVCNPCPDKYLDINLNITSLTNNAKKPLTPCGDTDLVISGQLAPDECREYELGDFSSESSASSIVAYSGNTQLFSIPAPTQDCVGLTNTCI